MNRIVKTLAALTVVFATCLGGAAPASAQHVVTGGFTWTIKPPA
jgi:hypothetical protein